ncbi:2265_t:CDS:10 [Acaulospora morrowiae]|uniref:2265_t:CDS:1 n=1 Tax=Acaulospora morrowiae TaxID=94023 RepID=A0A9N8WFT8_9GLOM|nr:2265_t:CDS:10 [Acaulospora morrowiae]
MDTTTYVQLNGVYTQNLAQDFEVLGKTISSCYAGDPVTLRSFLNGYGEDMIQDRKKYDGCLRELERLRHTSREQDDVFNWLLSAMESYIVQLQTDQPRFPVDLHPNELLKTLSIRYKESPLLKLLADILFDYLSFAENLTNGSHTKTSRINRTRCRDLFDSLAKTNSLWLLYWTLDYNGSTNFRCQLFMEFTIWKLSESNVPFTIFDFLIDIDLVAYQQCMIGLLDAYLNIAYNYTQRVYDIIPEHLGERLIISHLINMIVLHPEIVDGQEELIWNRLTVPNIQMLCYFEYVTRFSLCISPSGTVTSICESFLGWLQTWLFANTDSVIPHVFPICIMLDGLTNEEYVINGKGVDSITVTYLGEVVRTECATLIQQMAVALDECIVNTNSNDVSQSHLKEVIVRNFLDQDIGQSTNLRNYQILHLQLGVIYITRNSDYNLKQTLSMLYSRLGSKSEAFWLTILKCIGLTSKSVAKKLIQELLLTLFQVMPPDDQIIAERMIYVHELVATFELYWKDVFRLSIESLIGMVLVHEEGVHASSSIYYPQYTNIYRTLVYFVVTESDVSNITLWDLINGSFLTHKSMSKCILNAIGNSYHSLLRTFYHIINSNDDQTELSNSRWLLLLLLISSSCALTNNSIRNILECCDSLVDIWFAMMTRKSQLSSTSNEDFEWNIALSIMENLVFTFSKYPETFPYLPNLMLRKLMFNAEKVRNWPFALRSSEKVSTNLELMSKRQMQKFKYNAISRNDKSYSSTWHSINFNQKEAKNLGGRIVSSALRKKKFLIYLRNSDSGNSELDSRSIYNAWSNGRLFRILCMNKDLLSYDSKKTDMLARLLIQKLTTLEPPTSVTEHIIVPKSISYSRDRFLQSRFNDYPELWLLLDFLANDYRIFGDLHDILARSLLATNISFWYRMREQNSKKYSVELDAVMRLVEAMRKAHYVPQPLDYIGRLLPYVHSKDVGYLLYEIIWKFVLENWQLCPYSNNFNIDEGIIHGNNNLFGFSDRVQKMRLILQKNILTIPEHLTHIV